jgi:hypothetical protein
MPIDLEHSRDAVASDPLEYEWTGTKYGLALGEDEWFLDGDRFVWGSAITGTPTHWAVVKLADRHATVTICIREGEGGTAYPTCNKMFEGAALALAGGDVVGDIAKIFMGTDSATPLWANLYLDASGIPIRIERPEDASWCELANGEMASPGQFRECY